MININDIKNGMTVLIDGNIYLIVEFQHVKPGKGPAFVRIKLKNLRTGSTKPMQYLYSNGNMYNFMNMETYEQIDLAKENLGDNAKFLKEGLEVEVTFYKGEVLGINLPEKIEYEVTETEPAVKGNTATNATKEATLENGLTVKVPLFISSNERIIVSTKDGKYDSRA